MAQLSITLQAGVPKRQTFGTARFLTLHNLGDAALVDVDIEVAGFSQESLRSLRARDRIEVPSPGFEAATFTSATDCTIEVIASIMDIRLNNVEGQTVQANIVGTVPVEVTGPDPLPVSIAGPDPLPVANDRGNVPGTPVFVSGVTLDNTPAAASANAAAVAVAGAAVAVAAANAARLELRLTNLGTDPVAIGAAGLTWAQRCIVLQSGDTWVEIKGAALAWYGITAGGAASVTKQELTA